MLLIPAIDIKEGQCVRLKQGRMEDTTVFSDNPVEVGRGWREAGCRRLHLVDLDGAFAGEPRNRDVVREITRTMGDVPVQVGGGIRDVATIEAYLDAGVAQVIIGSQAVYEPEFLESVTAQFPGHIILGLDARNGRLATQGWGETSDVDALEFARWAGALDIVCIVYTDIERDGMQTGLNVASTVEMAGAAGLPVIASGGITDLGDLEQLKTGFAERPELLFGAITGRAIYAGSLDFRAGQALLDAAGSSGG